MQQLIIYVDVDDTLVRTFSGKRIPVPTVIKHIRELKMQGATLYCWSSGGSDYARLVAKELGILDVFTAFLPKPQMMLDDQSVSDWKYLIQVHPLSCGSKSLSDYRQEIQNQAVEHL